MGPFQKIVPFAITLEFEIHILLKGRLASVFIGNNGMVDDQIARDLGVDGSRVAAKLLACFTHDGKVDENRNTREILEENASGTEFDLIPHFARKAGLENALGQFPRAFVGVGMSKDVLENNRQR